MNCCKCFFKIQIRVCRITILACGFAVWTTPSPRGDWNFTLTILSFKAKKSELPPHREVIETSNAACAGGWHGVWTTPSPQGAWTEKSRYPKRYRDFFYKKLKKRRETGIYSERQECQPESQLLWKTCWHLSDFMVKSIQSGMTSAVLHAAERNTRWRTF